MSCFGRANRSNHVKLYSNTFYFVLRCRLLHFLGRQVSLITAPGNSKLLESAIAFEKLRYGYDIPLIVAPLISDTPNPEEWAKGIIEGVDHVISIEILGASKYVSTALFEDQDIDQLCY